MGPFDNALERLGITLPAAPKPVAAYVPFTKSHGGHLVYVSGQLPFKDGKLLSTGPTPSPPPPPPPPSPSTKPPKPPASAASTPWPSCATPPTATSTRSPKSSA